MKRLLYLVLFINSYVFSQNKVIQPVKLPVYPSFNGMATEFFKHYSIPETESDKKYTFAKKPDGWHLLLIDFIKDSVLKDNLFWERATNSYKYFSFKNQASSEPVTIPLEYNNWSNNYFNSISPFFGYNGWDADVIHEYGQKENLSDSVLNALANAYSEYSRNLLNRYLGFTNVNITYKKLRRLNSLTDEQLQNYRKYEHLAIETYKRLWKLNPKFENFVGDAYTVYSNEVMNCFLTLRFYQNEVEAQKELKQELYDPFYRCFAKNYLASCDSNAIIFTNGDNDTYPLLYVQEREGFRKDVLVANVSLLGSPQYINHLFFGIGSSSPITVCNTKELYINGLLTYAYIIKKQKDEQAMELKNLFNFICSSDTSTKYKYENEYFTYIPSTHFKLNVNKENAIKNKIVALDDTDKIVTEMDWHINGFNAIFQNELAIMDILASTDFKRPIYFAVSVSDEYFLNLEKYFQAEGLTYKIVPVKYDSYRKNEYGRVNTKILYDHIRNKFCNVNWDKTHIFISEAHQKIVSNYRYQYSKLASALIRENKLDNAREILSLCFKSFPVQLFPLNYWSISLIESYYQLKDNNKANELSTNLYNNCCKELERHEKDKLPLSDTDNYSVNLSLTTLKDLETMINRYTQSKLTNLIDSKIEKYKGVYNK
jgi:hypothetical protein